MNIRKEVGREVRKGNKKETRRLRTRECVCSCLDIVFTRDSK